MLTSQPPPLPSVTSCPCVLGITLAVYLRSRAHFPFVPHSVCFVILRSAVSPVLGAPLTRLGLLSFTLGPLSRMSSVCSQRLLCPPVTLSTRWQTRVFQLSRPLVLLPLVASNCRTVPGAGSQQGPPWLLPRARCAGPGAWPAMACSCQCGGPPQL